MREVNENVYKLAGINIEDDLSTIEHTETASTINMDQIITDNYVASADEGSVSSEDADLAVDQLKEKAGDLYPGEKKKRVNLKSSKATGGKRITGKRASSKAKGKKGKKGSKKSKAKKSNSSMNMLVFVVLIIVAAYMFKDMLGLEGILP